MAKQESSSQEVVKKLNKRTYQFERKGNEAQYTFNTTIEEHIDAARKELGKLNPIEEHNKAIVKKTSELLKEGIKAIKVRQKHKDSRQGRVGMGCCGCLRGGQADFGLGR